jgi:6-phosphogluconolactonase
MIAPELFTFSSTARLAHAAADTVVETLGAALEARDQASFVLTGGSTPVPLYRLLAAEYRHALDWSRVVVFFGDERHVPHDHDDSNFRMARETLLDGLPLSPDRIYPMPTSDTPETDARSYEETLRDYFGDGPPAFDLLLLGMGADGHIASLFPGSPALDEAERWVVATESPPSSPVHDRITLTFPAINAARTVLFLVAGESKQEALYAVHRTPGDAPPAERVEAQDRLLWFVDEAAAGDLS